MGLLLDLFGCLFGHKQVAYGPLETITLADMPLIGDGLDYFDGLKWRRHIFLNLIVLLVEPIVYSLKKFVEK